MADDPAAPDLPGDLLADLALLVEAVPGAPLVILGLGLADPRERRSKRGPVFHWRKNASRFHQG